MEKQKTKREILKDNSFKEVRDLIMSDVYHYIAWQINCKTSFYGRPLTKDEYWNTVIGGHMDYEKWEKEQIRKG